MLGDNLEIKSKYAEREQVSIFKEHQFVFVSGS